MSTPETTCYTVLYIDDNPDDREFYTALMDGKTFGNITYIVYAAENMAEAERLCDAHYFDAFMIDYYMPETEGVEVLNTLQARAPDKALPALILTGDPSQLAQAKSARTGAMDYLIKEMNGSPEKISAALQKVIGWAKKINDSAASDVPETVTEQLSA